MILQGVLLQLAGLLSHAALLGLGTGGRMEEEICLGETWWDREGGAGLGKNKMDSKMDDREKGGRGRTRLDEIQYGWLGKGRVGTA